MELLSPDIIMNLLLSYRDVQVCRGEVGAQHSGSDKPEFIPAMPSNDQMSLSFSL